MHNLIKKYPLASDQINKKELNVILDYASTCLDIDGDFVELGCYMGTTSLFLSRLLLGSHQKLWVYDSFEGLPPKSAQDQSPTGLNFKEGELVASKKRFIGNYNKAGLPLPKIKKAWFEELAQDDLPQSIAFAFIDGDYYNSIYISLKLVAPKIINNGYILVHDFQRTTLPGVEKAVNKFLAEDQNFALKKMQEHIAVISVL